MATQATAMSAAARTSGMPVFHDLSGHRQLDVAALKKLAAHPDNARKILAAQQKIFAQLDSMAETLAKDLAQYQAKAKDDGPAGQVSMAQLALIARKGQHNGKSRKELAKDLLIASIVNYGNLNWEPSDPSTSWTPERNPSTLLSLLMLGPIEEPVEQPTAAQGEDEQ